MAKSKKFLGFIFYFFLVSFYCPHSFTKATEFSADLVQAPNFQDQSQADGFYRTGVEQFNRGQLKEALSTLQQVLTIRRKLNDKAGEAAALDRLGKVYNDLSQYLQALENLQQALTIRREMGDRSGEGETLSTIGEVYSNLSQYPQALEILKQALKIALEVSDRQIEGETLYNFGEVYNRTSQHDEALESLQKALTIYRKIGDRRGEGRTLNNLGVIRRKLGQYQQALELSQQALAIAKNVSDRISEGRIFNAIGIVYDSLGDYPQALNFLQQSLTIRREIGNRAGEESALTSMASVYSHQGNYAEALKFYQQALEIAKAIGDRAGEGNILNNIGGVYYSLTEYPQALKFYNQALEIARAIGARTSEGNILNNIGLAHSNLGQYERALEFMQPALTIRREIGDKAGEGRTLHNIGSVYDYLNQSDKALEFLQQALAIRREIGDKAGEGTTLNSMGIIYDYLRQYDRAVASYKGALTILQALGSRAGEGRTLTSMGVLYYNLGEYSQALEFMQQGLGILKELGDRGGEGFALSHIGYLFQKQNQPELAIIFYKQSINIREAIRKDLRKLSREQQASFTRTVADTYRSLADLLLAQNRVLEARRVLDLLKLQELDDYLKNVQGNDLTVQGIELLSSEKRIWNEYEAIQIKAISWGKELTQLRQIAESNRLDREKKRLGELESLQQQAILELTQFFQLQNIAKMVRILQVNAVRESLDLAYLTSTRESLQKLKENAILFYPVILEDRLELVLVSADAPPIHRAVPVNRKQMEKAIASFRATLIEPRFRSSDMSVKQAARQLYDLLIKPIENDLAIAKTQTIIYAPDGQLRYLPLAALFDGERWLAERFRVNNITAASLTNFTGRSSINPHILAAAFTSGSYNFEVGTYQFTFDGLPFAGREVENLATLLPNTTKLLDRAFSREATVAILNDYNIVHLATHAAFVNGQPEDSFILFGNGDRVTLRDVQNWNLNNVDLVVLSACQTGVGGILGNGEEILGFGYQIQQAGAKASIASLWSVNDESTQILMNIFYNALQKGNVTKAEALRQAQIALIGSQYNHPYYWAPFILIGNGL